MKLYFDASEKDPERCNTLEHWKDHLLFNGMESMELIEAKPFYGSGYFWCKYHCEVGEVGESCGKMCKEYKPRNGKSGRCIHSTHLYTLSNNPPIKLTLRGLIRHR